MTRALLPARFLVLLASPWLLLAGRPAAQAEYRKSYGTDMAAFVEEVERVYPFFDLKGIREEWGATSQRLQQAAERCKKDADFLKLVMEGMACLRDAHVTFTACAIDFPEREPEFLPGVSFLPATEGRVVVMHPPPGKGAGDLGTGTVVLEIDGQDARAFLDEGADARWAEGGSFSSPQRARLFEYRTPLRGKRGAKHVLTVLDGTKQKKVKLSATQEVDGWPRYVHLPGDLKQVGRSFFYSRLEGGEGYMVLRRVDESLSEGIPKALEEIPDAKGWVVDLRGNSGGGYDNELKGRVDSIPGKVAVLIDAGCISAGETLARDFVELCDTRLFGETTAGSSSSKVTWTFPSGLASVRISTRTRTGLDGKGIEFLGITPHEPVEAVPEELAAGIDSCRARAREYLAGG